MQRPIVILMTATFFSFTTVHAKNIAPISINYLKKTQSFLGKKYDLYRVNCSDGKQQIISRWQQKEQPWCVGNNRSKCRDSQLQIATLSCQQ